MGGKSRLITYIQRKTKSHLFKYEVPEPAISSCPWQAQKNMGLSG